MTEGMSSPRLIGDDAIRSEPASDTVTSLRPTAEGSYTAPSDTNPAIFITLVKDTEGVPVGSVTINGNMPGAKVYSKATTDDQEPFKPVSTDDNDEATVSAAP